MAAARALKDAVVIQDYSNRLTVD
ncbi:hypothetical protein XHV734_3168 [Xanthomonas hortorum pv. vitians]|nr:hypothetical protein XHV734_3168 [Xanthomonas hortorum pv. vitians]